MPSLYGHWVVGKLVGDTVVTREEIAGLMQNLLVTDLPTVERIHGKRAKFHAERSLKEERKLPSPIPRLNFT